jgi:hypothetical protein
MPSNSVFFTVLAVPALSNVGWEIRVLDYEDLVTPVAVIAEWIEFSIAPELNGSGAGSITLDFDTPFWSTVLGNDRLARNLLDREYIWQAWEDGVLRFEWLGRVTEERKLDESETYGIVISGPGTAEMLRDACVLRPGFPLPPPANVAPENANSSKNSVPGYNWEFPVTWPAMHIWYRIFRAAQFRGTATSITLLFNQFVDSGGEEWEYVPTVETASGHGFRPHNQAEDLLEFLNDCTGQDASKHFAMAAEWYMHPGSKLDVRKVIGSHREEEVIFFEGGLKKKHRTRTREDIGNYIIVSDIYGQSSFTTDADSISKFRQREFLYNQNPNVTDTARRDAIAQVVKKQRRGEKSTWIIEVPYESPGRRPFIDYVIGDWIGVANRWPGQSSAVETFRVLSIGIKVDSDINVTVELTLESLLDFRQRQLERKLTQIVNQVSSGTLPSLPDVKVPVTPAIGDYLGWDGEYWTNLPIEEGGGGGGGGVQVFIQPDDPALTETVNTGDFWLQTSVV